MDSTDKERIKLLTKRLFESSETDLLNSFKELNRYCVKGNEFQNLIVNEDNFIHFLTTLIKCHQDEVIRMKSFQLLANLCVQNKSSQCIVWNESSEIILDSLKSDNNNFVNIAAMILHNMFLNDIEKVNINNVLPICLDQAFKLNPIPEFLHIFLDHLICSELDIVSKYNNLEDKKNFLHYVYDHVQNEETELINKSLVHHISLEFKKKSDCILKTISSYVESVDPEIVIILLDIIATISSQEKYRNILKDDRSLFLNLGCLLQAIHKMGKNSNNIFTPIQKLDALLPSSKDKEAIESEISYSFKTKLVRSLANLSYRNRKNQELAREMEIMQSIFECTNADARNPLIKEWSILAVRNLCEENFENQEIVKQLTKMGDAPNPILNEFGIDKGIFRIKK